MLYCKTIYTIIYIVWLCLIAAAVPVASAADTAAEEELKYDAGSLRDPFVPLVTEKGLFIGNIQLIESLNDINLEGIVWDPAGAAICIVNGQVLRKGDEIGGAKITEIRESSIEILIGGHPYTLELIVE